VSRRGIGNIALDGIGTEIPDRGRFFIEGNNNPIVLNGNFYFVALAEEFFGD
jgi:hypothetical protein